MAKRRERHRRPARRASFRDPKPLILVVCEGEQTEPQYLRGFERACRNARVKIEIAKERGVPMTLVRIAKSLKADAEEQARRERDDNLAYDAVWCVFDVDDHPRVSDAIVMARDNGVELAISNPCFELWLLLHFRPNPGMQSRQRITEMLCGHVSDYRKHVDFELYLSGYAQAVKRASSIEKNAKSRGDSLQNPSTRVHVLTESIRGDAGIV